MYFIIFSIEAAGQNTFFGVFFWDLVVQLSCFPWGRAGEKGGLLAPS